MHFFKNAIYTWKKQDHKVCIAARDKDLTLSLLDEYCLTYTCLSHTRPGVISLALELFEHESKLIQIAKKFKPDVMVSIGGTFQVHVAKMLGIRSIVFSDTEMATVANRITYPFADVICTPSCYRDDWGKKHVRYQGYQELAYTHPNWFTPNPSILKELGVNKGDKLFVIRFVAWQSGHDIMKKGFSSKGKYLLVKSLIRYGRVVLTSESELPLSLEQYRMRLSPTKIHDLLAFSTLYIGESATMASESAILGIPFIFVSPVGRGYTDEQENKYKLGFTIHPDQEECAINTALELAQSKNLRNEWQIKKQHLLQDKIDVTAWMVDFVESLL